MKNYFINIQTKNKEHCFRVCANVDSCGGSCEENQDEEEFCQIAEPDEVEILAIYLQDDSGREREITDYPESLEEQIIAKIKKEEEYGF